MWCGVRGRVFTYGGEWVVCALEGKGECDSQGIEVQWHARYCAALLVLAGLGLVVKFRGPAEGAGRPEGGCRRWLLRLCARV